MAANSFARHKVATWVIDKRIDQVTRAIEVAGNTLRPLLARLTALEEQRLTADAERMKLERLYVEQQQERPDERKIQARWKRLMELWEFLTEDERTEAMQALVERVDITTKTEGTCRIRISGQIPISNVELNRNYRAGLRISYIFPDRLRVHFAVPRKANALLYVANQHNGSSKGISCE